MYLRYRLQSLRFPEAWPRAALKKGEMAVASHDPIASPMVWARIVIAAGGVAVGPEADGSAPEKRREGVSGDRPQHLLPTH